VSGLHHGTIEVVSSSLLAPTLQNCILDIMLGNEAASVLVVFSALSTLESLCDNALRKLTLALSAPELPRVHCLSG